MRLLPITQSGHTSAAIEGAAEIVHEVIKATVALYARKGYIPPWTGYIAEENGLCVGGCGFAGPPNEGEVEIAYFTFPDNEGRGIATRMVIALLASTAHQAQSLTLSFIAHTLPQEGPSTSILKKLGFRLEGAINHPEDGKIWKWRLPHHSGA